MPRGTKDGSIKRVAGTKQIIVRKRYTDLKGRPREKKRTATTATQAARLKRVIQQEIDDELAGADSATRVLDFAELAVWCTEREFKPAEYVGETKIAGLRSWKSIKYQLQPLVAFFGKMNLTAIAYDDLVDYKRARLKLKTVTGQPRSIASVNRELALMRRMLFLAIRERWIREHPFHRGAPLVQMADEVKRMRVLTWDEEAALLAACTGKRKGLRLALVCALETGLRHNEQFTLALTDVDLDDRVITLRSFNSKTAQTRLVPISERLLTEILAASPAASRLFPGSAGVPPARLRQESHDSQDEPSPWAAATQRTLDALDDNPRRGLLFRHADSKRAFHAACTLAGIEGLRWHDLRHTAITRMLHHYQIPAAEVMKISGHSNWKTFLRYVNIDREIARSIGARIDAVRAEWQAQTQAQAASERLETFPVTAEREDDDGINQVSEAVN